MGKNCLTTKEKRDIFCMTMQTISVILIMIGLLFK